MRRDYIDTSDLSLLRTLGLSSSGSAVRASDAERERAAEALRQHHTDGRLTTEELDERTERVYGAKTRGDLDQQFGDLPRLRTPEEERPQRRRGRHPILVPILVAFVALAVVSSAHFLWLLWPLLMFFVFFRFAFWGSRGRSRPWPESRRRY